jgi:molybdopterin synthase catalytic subunit
MSNPDFLILQEGPIILATVIKTISSATTQNIGAYSIFLGKVRADNVNNKIVKEIEYSAYSPMVETVSQEIYNSINQKFDDLKIIKIFHSTGIVKVDEFSLFVFVGCSHRSQSFKAVEETVEQVKTKLPIWKKEIFEDGSYNWPKNIA